MCKPRVLVLTHPPSKSTLHPHHHTTTSSLFEAVFLFIITYSVAIDALSRQEDAQNNVFSRLVDFLRVVQWGRPVSYYTTTSLFRMFGTTKYLFQWSYSRSSFCAARISLSSTSSVTHYNSITSRWARSRSLCTRSGHRVQIRRVHWTTWLETGPSTIIPGMVSWETRSKEFA